jgi:hypothetical protein
VREVQARSVGRKGRFLCGHGVAEILYEKELIERESLCDYRAACTVVTVSVSLRSFGVTYQIEKPTHT